MFDWQIEAKRQWNKMSDNWQQNSREMWDTGSRKTVIPLFAKYLSPQKGPVLDAGCGEGYGSYKLALAGFKVLGIDLADEMIVKARQHVREEMKERLTFDIGDITQLKYPDQHFQGILSVNAIEWIPAPVVALKEFHRVLKPGGILCLCVLGPTAAPRQHSYPRLYGKPVIQNTMMPWECEKLVGENGFEIVDEEGVYKRGVTEDMTERLSKELKQALSFLWIFILKKIG